MTAAQGGEPLIRWDWVVRHGDDILAALAEHLVLTAIAVGAGFVISMGLSVLVLRRRRLRGAVTGVAGVLFTVPSIALFALLVPFTGLSLLTAEIGLVSYTLLILVRNILAGIDGVPAEVREAALGMGYTPTRMFWSIELPLALPVIIAGVRIATVTVVGLVTVTALIGLGGVGSFILDGLRRFFWTTLLVGSGLSVALAVLLDVVLLGVQRLLTPWARRAA